MEYPKKLIEVALPLDDINREASREKSIRQGHPSTLHLWWARRPLAAARAVLFAQLVNDPGGKRGHGAYKGQTKEDAQKERERLFDIIRDLVKWENTNNEEILECARKEIRKSWEETCKITGEDSSKLPSFCDPFAGGGAIPLEAQRLGFETYASDINPIAVLINKSMLEIPPRFAGRKPIGPISTDEVNKTFDLEEWSGTKGLAEDVRRYGIWMRNEAEKRIGHLYPKVEITKEMIIERPDLEGLVGQKLTVIAWLWVRTVNSSNLAYRSHQVPLASTYVLSSKTGKEVYVDLIPEGNRCKFQVKTGKPINFLELKKGNKMSGNAFKCIYSNTPITYEYIDSEANKGNMDSRLIGMVAQSKNGRIYLSPTNEAEEIAAKAVPKWKPEVPCRGTFASNAQGRHYGFKVFGDYFSSRQLLALTTFSDLTNIIREDVLRDAISAGMSRENKGLNDGGIGARAYSEAITIYLTCALGKAVNAWSSLASWNIQAQSSRSTFSRQSIPMVWDYVEVNPFSNSSGNFLAGVKNISKAITNLQGKIRGEVSQVDATAKSIKENVIISTDPPYYDNIAYADLSDFFYVWMRQTTKHIYPQIFTTISVPKEQELVVASYRHGSKGAAEEFFLNGMTKAIKRLGNICHPGFPITLYYAFKQSETSKEGTLSTAWEIFMESIISSGLLITGTWPMRTERPGRMISIGTNALASSIVLVCRKRSNNSSTVSRKQFLREVKEVLPDALEDMIGGKEGVSPIAPVDLAQAAIGPGMAIFSKYQAVLEADGNPMTIHEALILINKTIDEYFTEAESDMDADTRFCVDWFQQYGFKDGVFGEADILAKAKCTSVDGVQDAGVILAKGGKVRLVKVSEYPQDWNPKTDKRTPIWEACHHMCRALQVSESEAGMLLARMPEKTEAIRQLAYRLYTLCERKGWAEDAGIYNGLITSWHAILEESYKVGHKATQKTLGI